MGAEQTRPTTFTLTSLYNSVHPCPYEAARNAAAQTHGDASHTLRLSDLTSAKHSMASHHLALLAQPRPVDCKTETSGLRCRGMEIPLTLPTMLFTQGRTHLQERHLALMLVSCRCPSDQDVTGFGSLPDFSIFSSSY